MTTSKAIGEIVGLAGGRIVGRTKLQKSVCALELVGLGYGFRFHYKHFGPYCDELKIACSDAEALGYVAEKTETATWGGWYSVFEAPAVNPANSMERARSEVLSVTVNADSVDLELAITAAFLAANGSSNPWGDVEAKKPDKAVAERVRSAKELYKRLLSIKTPRPLSAIV